MAINGNFPNTSPSLLLDFAKTEVLDPRITFTRASTAVYYNGITTTKAEENYILQSQDFTTTWTATNANVSANTSVAPDTTTTADRILFNGGSAACRVNQTLPANTNSNQVFSVFIKNDGVNYVQLSTDNANVFADFDLLNVTVGTTGTSATANITASANSYVRCAIAFATNAVSSVRIQGVDSNTAAHNSVLTNAANVIVWGAQVEQRSVNYPTAYTATTTQAITTYVPTLQTAIAGTARFDHNPTTGESLGLLIEEQRSNLLTYSAEFDNAAWSTINGTITANTIVAPDGTLTGDVFRDNTSTGSHAMSTNVSVTSGTTYTFSCYMKSAGRSFGTLRALTAFTDSTAFFNLSTGAAGSFGGSITSTTITSVGNGWYRCSITLPASSTASAAVRAGCAAADGTLSYTGDGYSGIYIWGAQLEAGAFPTSYIATGAASVTRSPDSASMTGTNFSSWFNNETGTIYAEAMRPYTVVSSSFPRVVSIGVSGTNAYAIELLNNQNTSERFGILNNAVNETVQDFSNISSNTFFKFIGAYQVNNSNAALNGTANTSATTCTIPIVSQIRFGDRQDGIRTLNGYIRKIAYYPVRINNSQNAFLTGW